MDIKFTLPNTQPFSVNKMHYKRSKVRTQECRRWYDSVFKLLSADECIIKNIASFRKLFNEDTHQLSVTYTFNIPKNKLLIKSGRLSKTSGDVDNGIKCLTDALFDGRFYSRGAKNFNINDSYITSLSVAKRISKDDTYSIDVIVLRHPLEDIL